MANSFDMALERIFGDALLVDHSFADPNHNISTTDMEQHATAVKAGDIVLVRTGWTEKQWGSFLTYYMVLPFCASEAGRRLISRGEKAIEFDCFSENCAHLPDIT